MWSNVYHVPLQYRIANGPIAMKDIQVFKKRGTLSRLDYFWREQKRRALKEWEFIFRAEFLCLLCQAFWVIRSEQILALWEFSRPRNSSARDQLCCFDSYRLHIGLSPLTSVQLLSAPFNVNEFTRYLIPKQTKCVITLSKKFFQNKIFHSNKKTPPTSKYCKHLWASHRKVSWSIDQRNASAELLISGLQESSLIIGAIEVTVPFECNSGIGGDSLGLWKNINSFIICFCSSSNQSCVSHQRESVDSCSS